MPEYKPPVVVQHTPEDAKLLSIDEYKGKSVEELEAILDAHNKKRTEPEPSYSKPQAPVQKVLEKRQSKYKKPQPKEKPILAQK